MRRWRGVDARETDVGGDMAAWVVNASFYYRGELRARPGSARAVLPRLSGPVRALISYRPLAEGAADTYIISSTGAGTSDEGVARWWFRAINPTQIGGPLIPQPPFPPVEPPQPPPWQPEWPGAFDFSFEVTETSVEGGTIRTLNMVLTPLSASAVAQPIVIVATVASVVKGSKLVTLADPTTTTLSVDLSGLTVGTIMVTATMAGRINHTDTVSIKEPSMDQACTYAAWTQPDPRPSEWTLGTLGDFAYFPAHILDLHPSSPSTGALGVDLRNIGLGFTIQVRAAAGTEAAILSELESEYPGETIEIFGMSVRFGLIIGGEHSGPLGQAVLGGSPVCVQDSTPSGVSIGYYCDTYLYGYDIYVGFAHDEYPDYRIFTTSGNNTPIEYRYCVTISDDPVPLMEYDGVEWNRNGTVSIDDAIAAGYMAVETP